MREAHDYLWLDVPVFCPSSSAWAFGVQCVGAVEGDSVNNWVQWNIIKTSKFQLLTDFLGSRIHSFWFSVFVEKLTTLIKAGDHFCMSTECSQHNTGEQSWNKHGLMLVLCYRADTRSAAALNTQPESEMLMWVWLKLTNEDYDGTFSSSCLGV